jgi:hypothetical protein
MLKFAAKIGREGLKNEILGKKKLRDYLTAKAE